MDMDIHIITGITDTQRTVTAGTDTPDTATPGTATPRTAIPNTASCGMGGAERRPWRSGPRRFIARRRWRAPLRCTRSLHSVARDAWRRPDRASPERRRPLGPSAPRQTGRPARRGGTGHKLPLSAPASRVDEPHGFGLPKRFHDAVVTGWDAVLTGRMVYAPVAALRRASTRPLGPRPPAPRRLGAVHPATHRCGASRRRPLDQRKGPERRQGRARRPQGLREQRLVRRTDPARERQPVRFLRGSGCGRPGPLPTPDHAHRAHNERAHSEPGRSKRERPRPTGAVRRSHRHGRRPLAHGLGLRPPDRLRPGVRPPHGRRLHVRGHPPEERPGALRGQGRAGPLAAEALNGRVARGLLETLCTT